MYRALYESIAAHSRVVVDVGASTMARYNRRSNNSRLLRQPRPDACMRSDRLRRNHFAVKGEEMNKKGRR